MINFRVMLLLLTAIAMSYTVVNGQTVRVITMSGEAVAGQQLEITEDSANLSLQSGELKALPISEIAKIEWLKTDAAEIPGTTLSLELVDDTKLLAQQVTVEDSVATVQLITGLTATIPTRNIRWIRFKTIPQGSELETDWSEIMESTEAGDLLIVRREIDDILTLSGVEGVLGTLSETSLAFKFDDNEVEVERERLDTLRYYHPAGRKLPEVQAKLVDRFGQILYLRDWRVDSETFVAKTLSNVELPNRVADIVELDLEVGRVLHFADVEPSTFEWTPFVGGTLEANHLQNLFAMTRNSTFSGKPLSLYSATGFGSGTTETRTFTRGMALRSQSRLVYRVPEGFKRLIGWAGIDPTVRPRGNVSLLIEGDGQALFSSTVDGESPEPVKIDLEIEGVRRLSIQILFGEAGDLGDRLHLIELRAVK